MFGHLKARGVSNVEGLEFRRQIRMQFGGSSPHAVIVHVRRQENNLAIKSARSQSPNKVECGLNDVTILGLTTLPARGAVRGESKV